MATSEGNAGRGARHYEVDQGTPSVLRGVLASDEEVVYPDDYCLECVREGRTSARCFHRHWEVADAVAPAERRDTVN